MNWRSLGLLAALCLTSACKEEPVGMMEPIPRPPGSPATPAKQAAATKPAAESKPDVPRVVLRWKLDAPTAFTLTTHSSESAPSSADSKSPAPAGQRETSSIFVLRKTESGDYAFRIAPQGPGGDEDQGTMSERGFVLDGLSGALRNTAVLVLELPREPVGQGDTWSLGTDLVDLGSVPQFVEQKAERQNHVKLTALTPAENGEQVATLEYELSESVSGQLRVSRPPAQKQPPDAKDTAGDNADAPEGPQPASAQMRVKGRGEFLVKAGHWRSWEATITSHTEGAPLPGLANGERSLRLTPLEQVPPELLPTQAKK